MLRNALTLCLLALATAAASAPPPDAITPDGGRYFGPLVAGRMQGKGRIEWDNGGIYEGELREGMLWGQGELRYPDGDLYRGQFVRGNRVGTGRLETSGGDVYEGHFDKDDFTGQGVYARKGGGRYEGEFLKWKFQGRGRYEDGEGDVWEGSFVQGRLEGPGKATSRRGSYAGGFKNWAFNGSGVLKLANGDVYEGGFENGLYSGKGTLTYAKAKADGRTKDSGEWRYGTLPNDSERAKTHADIETALYAQRRLLDQALASLGDREAGRINLYLLAVAGDGSQEVFRREVEYVQNEFALRFGTGGRSISLVNSRSTAGSAPMATVTSIREALNAIARRMHKDEDILFLFLTSHGSREHQLSLNENGMDLQDLPAATLARLLKESGIVWKVVVVSACYSGGFVEPLQDGHTLIMTAARKDRTSFGCADENDFTYFGRAYFKESLPKAASFQDAFVHAEALVHEWEEKDASGAAQASAPVRVVAKLVKSDDNHSFPQISTSSAIDEHLKRWWAQPMH